MKSLTISDLLFGCFLAIVGLALLVTGQGGYRSAHTSGIQVRVVGVLPLIFGIRFIIVAFSKKAATKDRNTSSQKKGKNMSIPP